MSTWKITPIKGKKIEIKNPIFIEGLPGIGNVGKVAVDFLIEELEAKKVYDIFSFTFPHSVFVNEDNLVELPHIGIYHKKVGKNDFLFLAGDVQPMDEMASYEFTDMILNIAQKHKCKEIITLGGIGLHDVPKNPKVYCTANSSNIIKKYNKSKALDPNLYGVVGPIVGVSGLLLGLGKRRNIEAISLLAETHGHPAHLGITGARELLKILNCNLNLGLNMKDLECEIKEIEEDMYKKTQELGQISKKTALQKLKDKISKETSYIG